MNEPHDTQPKPETEARLDQEPEVNVEAIQDLDPGADADYIRGGHPCTKSQED